jgi:formate dehydrogenase subunit delta
VNADHLVKMANQIGQFYEVYSDHDVALTELSQHLRRFWDPRMRREFLDHASGPGRGALRTIVLEAVLAHEALLREGTSESLAAAPLPATP